MTPLGAGAPDPSAPFAVVAGHAASPVVLHVPHASTRIPVSVRQQILLNDAALDGELRAMTDAYTDEIATRATGLADHPRPWSFVNGLSRLVVDPERFTGEDEVMNDVGMGAVYTRTSTGRPLREDDPAHRDHLLATYFEPYATALGDLVDARLAATGRAVIIDIHSYPPEPLPYELYAHEPRPEICLGFDDEHTPDWLRIAAHDAFAAWSVAADGPFKGTYVPLRHLGSDPRVSSVMLEIRRDLFVRPDGSAEHEAIGHLSTATADLIRSAS